jgi:hypothetical protein
MTTPLSTYTDLVQKCQDWLFGRADIAPQVPTFIRLFEAKANRKLLCRQMEARTITTVNPNDTEAEFLDLPSDFQTMRRVRLVGAVNGRKPRLKFATGAQLDDLRDKNPSPGQPIWFSIFGDELELCPTPNAVVQVEMVYRVYIPPLGGVDADTGLSIDTNWLLTLAPDTYLYGALMEAAPYLHDDERIPVWASGVQAALQDLNILSDEATYNAGPLVMRRNASGYS